MCFKLYLKNINRLGTSDIEWQSIASPSVANFDNKLEAQREGGGGVLPYMGYICMCRCEGYGFQAVYCRIGYINQSVCMGLE